MAVRPGLLNRNRQDSAWRFYRYAADEPGYSRVTSPSPIAALVAPERVCTSSFW